MTNYRQQFEMTIEDATLEGAYLEYLHFGEPADPAVLARIEGEVLGAPMEPTLREFFVQMNGLQFCWWKSDRTSGDASLVPATKGPLKWNEVSNEFTPLWKMLTAKASEVGIVCIPDAATMFESDWAGMLGLPAKKEFLFDAFHHYRGCTLRDGKVSLTSDAWAAHDHLDLTVSDYFKQLTTFGGSERRFLTSNGPERFAVFEAPQRAAPARHA